MMAPVSVQLLDNAGNPVRMAGVPVSLAPISGPARVSAPRNSHAKQPTPTGWLRSPISAA